MRVVSWNMGGQTFGAATHADAWTHLREVLRPDIAVLQEAHVPDSLGSADQVYAQEVSNVGWTTAVYTRGSAATTVPVPVSGAWMDWVRLAAVDVAASPLGPLRIVSVHPSFERFDPALLIQRPDLSPKLEIAASVWTCDVAYVLARSLVQDKRFIVAGDWNTARLFDRTSTQFDPGSGEAFFERAHADGWVDLYFKRHQREGRTWFRGQDHGYQLDHAFSDLETAERLRDAWIDERAAVDPRMSDHAPLVLDFD